MLLHCKDIHTGAASLAANTKQRLALWNFIKANWEQCRDHLSGRRVLDRFLRMGLKEYSSHEIEQDISAFFKDKDNRGYDRALKIIADTVKTNANYKDRDGKVLFEWLQTHGYA